MDDVQPKLLLGIVVEHHQPGLGAVRGFYIIWCKLMFIQAKNSV